MADAVEMPWNFERDKVSAAFKEDGRIHHYIRETVDTVMNTIRGTDPDAPLTRDDIENIIRESSRVGALMGRREFNNGDGEGNWKSIALWALGALQAVCIVVMGLIWNNVTQTHDDVTQIKCKLDPQCRIVVSK